ncbi:hypothetical protein ACS3QZ_19660 (plasmid) [Shimia sp. W99]
MNDKYDRHSLSVTKCASELASTLIHDEEHGLGFMSGDLLQRSFEAYSVPLYHVHEKREPIWQAITSSFGLFQMNRLLQKYQDHGDFERFAEVWLSAEPLIEGALQEFEGKDGCLSCAEVYFFSCRNLGDVLSLRCSKCVWDQNGRGRPATVKLTNLPQADRSRLKIVNKALELCEIKHRCCQECLSQMSMNS